MIQSNILGIIFALTSAFIWGGGDFCGGFASRKVSQYHVLALSALSGAILLLISSFIWRESFPAPVGILIAASAGISGAVGIAALYRALATGGAANVAPISAVIGAILPVCFNGFIQGLPHPTQLAGFALALLGIWIVSQNAEARDAASRRGFWLAILAGFGFGGFFILIAQVGNNLVFTPLVISRSFAFLTGLILVRANGLPAPSFKTNPIALLAGFLDAAGNVFYLLAQQYTRLDIAAVLSSLYPASTVLLACLILKEKISLRQWIGIVICVIATMLIVL